MDTPTATRPALLLTHTTRDLLNAAVDIGVIDAAGLALMAHEADVAGDILRGLDRIADALRHTDGDALRAWVLLRDAVRWLQSNAPDAADPCGFAAESRVKHTARVAAHGIRV